MGSFFGLNSPTPGSTNSDFILLYSESSLFLLSLNLTEANFFFLNISLIVKVFFNVILVSFLSSLISSFSFSFSFSLFILVLISLLILSLSLSFSFSSSESISLLHVSILSISLIIMALLLNSCISSLSLFSLSSFNFTFIFLNKLRVCLFLTKGLFFSFCFILINLSNKNAYVFIPFNKSLIIPFIICLYVFTFSSSLLSDSICNLTSDSISFLLYCILFNLINFS